MSPSSKGPGPSPVWVVLLHLIVLGVAVYFAVKELPLGSGP